MLREKNPRMLRHCYTVKCFVLAMTDLATLWRDKLHEAFHYVTYPATAKIAKVVAESRIKFYFSCNLSRNDFGRYRVGYTVKCFVQLVPPKCRQNIAKQRARIKGVFARLLCFHGNLSSLRAVISFSCNPISRCIEFGLKTFSQGCKID